MVEGVGFTSLPLPAQGEAGRDITSLVLPQWISSDDLAEALLALLGTAALSATSILVAEVQTMGKYEHRQHGDLPTRLPRMYLGRLRLPSARDETMHFGLDQGQ